MANQVWGRGKGRSLQASGTHLPAGKFTEEARKRHVYLPEAEEIKDKKEPGDPSPLSPQRGNGKGIRHVKQRKWGRQSGRIHRCWRVAYLVQRPNPPGCALAYDVRSPVCVAIGCSLGEQSKGVWTDQLFPRQCQGPGSCPQKMKLLLSVWSQLCMWFA